MKIVHISAYYIEDLARGYQVYELVREQIKAGHDVHIVTCDNNIGNKNYIENAKKIGKNIALFLGISTSESGATIHRLSISFKIFGRLWWNGYQRKMVELQPDLVIVHNILEFQALRICFFFEKLNCRIIFDDHTTINVVRKGFLGKFAYGIFRLFFAKKLYKVAHKIVGISDSCVGVLNSYFGLGGEKVSMIPLGCNINIYYPDLNKRLSYREKMAIQNDEILIVYTGKVYDEKKVHLIVEALNDKFFQEFRIIIHIVGTVYESYKDFLNSIVNNANHKVILTPNVNQEELARIYNAADICVWPAHTTTSTLDASACGCPIICSDYKKERYSYGNGIGIKDGDIDSLKRAFMKLLNNTELRLLMGDRGICMIIDNHKWQDISRRFIDFS